jgi:hypothetical protein
MSDKRRRKIKMCWMRIMINFECVSPQWKDAPVTPNPDWLRTRKTGGLLCHLALNYGLINRILSDGVGGLLCHSGSS